MLDPFIDILSTKGYDVIINISVAAGDTAPCPGQTYHVCVSYNNLGSAVSGATFTIDITPLVGLTLSNATSSIDCNCTPVISGQTVTCSPPSFPANKNCIICFDVTVPPCPGIGCGLYGTPLTTIASISNSYYNESTSINTIDCSFDPNDKLVAPKGCGPNRNIGRGEPLTYSIRFQNTGTAPAHNIVLKDALDNDLDISTLRIIATTHTITRLEIIPDNSLIISYEGIELPDSSSNPEGSIGSVVFSILPKNNIPDSTTIINQAGIYFDYNEVVLTNTTLNTIRDNPYPVADFSANHSCTNTGFVYDFTYTGNTANNASFLWDFGSDATPSSSTAQNPSGIIFNSTGTKQVLLTVTCFGCVSSITKPVEIINVHCGNNNQKILVCHIPSGNPNNPQTICISPIALPAHLAHGDCVGPCASNLKMLKINNDTANESIQFYIYPNPSDNISTIIFSTPFDDFVTIDIYNCMGVFVKNVYKNITNGNKEYKLQFNIKTLSNGVYYCILKTNFEQKIIKLVILK